MMILICKNNSKYCSGILKYLREDRILVFFFYLFPDLFFNHLFLHSLLFLKYK